MFGQTLISGCFEDDQVSWHELIPVNLDHLANPEILPLVAIEDCLHLVSPEDFPLVLNLILVVALPVFEEILEGRSGNHKD